MSETASTSTITPIYRIRRVMFGAANNLELIGGLDPLNDTRATLNTLYGVQGGTIPTVHPALAYFGVGIRGRRNIDTDNLSQPYDIKPSNMNLYGQLPIRCVPVEQDLSDTDRANYRIRRIITPTGSTQQYAAYYLKKLVKDNSKVQFYKLDSNGNQEVYTPDYSNLSPTPPTTTTNGNTTDVSQEISAVSVMTAVVTGAEISEALSVMYNGDARYGMISEIGLYTGTDQVIQTSDYAGNLFSYTESVMTQLHTHYTFNGTDMSTPNATYSEQFSIGSGRVILL